MNYSRTIRDYCLQNKGMVFDMSYEHRKHFEMVPYRTFCKILSRLEEEGILKTYSKGVYLITSKDMKDDPVISFYANDETGMIVGYKMYNALGITEHQEKPTVIYTNAMETTTKNIGDEYRLELMPIHFDDYNKNLITCLELIENKNKIIDCDLWTLNSVVINYLQNYHDLTLEEILPYHRYSYSTIATLDELLGKLHIENRAIKIAKKYYFHA